MTNHNIPWLFANFVFSILFQDHTHFPEFPGLPVSTGTLMRHTFKNKPMIFFTQNKIHTTQVNKYHGCSSPLQGWILVPKRCVHTYIHTHTKRQHCFYFMTFWDPLNGDPPLHILLKSCLSYWSVCHWVCSFRSEVPEWRLVWCWSYEEHGAHAAGDYTWVVVYEANVQSPAGTGSGALNGGSPMSHVDLKKWPCRLSVLLQFPCRF